MPRVSNQPTVPTRTHNGTANPGVRRELLQSGEAKSFERGAGGAGAGPGARAQRQRAQWPVRPEAAAGAAHTDDRGERGPGRGARVNSKLTNAKTLFYRNGITIYDHVTHDGPSSTPRTHTLQVAQTHAAPTIVLFRFIPSPSTPRCAIAIGLSLSWSCRRRRCVRVM